jgi:hypothetical protein
MSAFGAKPLNRRGFFFTTGVRFVKPRHPRGAFLCESSDEIPIWELAVHAREHDRICRLAGLHCRISFNARSHDRSGFRSPVFASSMILLAIVCLTSSSQCPARRPATGYKRPRRAIKVRYCFDQNNCLVSLINNYRFTTRAVLGAATGFPSCFLANAIEAAPCPHAMFGRFQVRCRR